ncbi:MAG: PD-(D/E)XK nuclease family protein, partial [Clostridiales bacterium]|nr:PD-(D/E)XK nuclease family protein [Clostridiales bacterium]
TGSEREARGLCVPAQLGTDGPAGRLTPLSQMGRLSRRITGLLREMGEALHRGEIAPLPVSGVNYEKTCEYCDYRPVCAGRREPEVREIPAMKHPEALEALEEGGGGDA